MTKLHEDNTREISLIKYTRSHLLALFDALHTNVQFATLSLSDFPDRSSPRSIHQKRQPKIDINQDSDGASVAASDIEGQEDGDGEDGEERVLADGGQPLDVTNDINIIDSDDGSLTDLDMQSYEAEED